MRNIFKFVLILFSLNILNCQQSCREISKYYADNYNTFCLVQLANVPVQAKNYIEVHLSFAAKLSSGNNWQITLNNQDAYKDLINGRNLVLKFIPLITNPLPVVTGVYLNNNRLCSDPPARGSYVTTFKLSYTYTINNLPQQYPVYSKTTENPYQFYQTQSNQNPFEFYNTQKQTVNRQQSINRIASELTFECGTNKQKAFTALVVGGTTGKDQFPWLAALYSNGRGFFCGGTLLSKRIVATAAHCIQNKYQAQKISPYDTTIYFGKYMLGEFHELNSVDSGVNEFVIHPSWNSNDERFDGDISLAILSKTIRFTDHILPLCIWPQTSGFQDLVNKRGIIAGWGVTASGRVSETPMFVVQPVVDEITCLRSNSVFSKLTSASTFCVGDKEGQAPCQGDSGGAFMYRNPADNKFYFRGIVSAGLRDSDFNCDAYDYTIFTDAARYTDWIRRYIDVHG